MCIRITFPPTAEQIAEAQWALINILEQTITSNWRYRDARQSLHEALRHARSQADSPRQWATAFVQVVLDTISTLQSAANATFVAAAQIERPQSGIVDSLKEQINTLTQSRDSFLRESIERGARVTELEEALRLDQDKHRREVNERRREIDEHHRDVSDLQATIADLNRIVADQQERLDALGR